jgi:non-specific serine/threonine protein kinase
VVRIDTRYDIARYGLLETLREYALEKLQTSGAESARIRERHATYYSELVQQLDPAAPTTLLKFTGEGEALTTPIFEILDGIHDNVGAALTSLVDAQRATAALTLLRALGPLWSVRGPPADARNWVDAVLELAASSTESVPGALYAQVLMFGGSTARRQGDTATGRRLLDRSITLWRSLGDEVGLAQALVNLGESLCVTEEFDEAYAVLTEACVHARAGGNAFTIALALGTLGNLYRVQMQYERAAALLHETEVVARTIERASNRVWLHTFALGLLGGVISRQGDVDEAMTLLKAALAEMSEIGVPDTRVVGLCLGWMADILIRTGNPARAAILLGAAEPTWRTRGMALHPRDRAARERNLKAVQTQLDQDAFADSWAYGESMTTPEAIAYALGET